jgi:hypothetical protein
MRRTQANPSGSMSVAVALVAVVVAARPAAAQLISGVADPAGDVSTTVNGSRVEAYQDIVEASIELIDGQFVFAMEVAAPIPARPALPNGAKLLEWSFRLRTDLSTCASGYPYPPAATLTSPEVTHCAQFMIFVVSDGTGFLGMLIDRRSSDTAVTTIPVTVRERNISASIDAALIGNPHGFRWTSRTETWFSNLGAMGYAVIDAAPDEGLFAIWPL